MSFNSFMYFSMMFRSENVAILLVMTINFLLLEQIKLVEISLLMFAMCIFDCIITLSTLFAPMGMIIYFLNEYLVIILNLGLFFWLDLFIISWISKILLRERFEKMSLILKISLMLFLYHMLSPPIWKIHLYSDTIP